MSAENEVDLPTLGFPTSPIRMDIILRKGPYVLKVRLQSPSLRSALRARLLYQE